MIITKPPYGLAKVQALIAGIKDDDGLSAVDAKTYNALTLREKFTYHMIHGEADAQMCDAMPPVQEEQLKIFGYLPDIFDDYGWSERQLKFMTQHRDSVMFLIKESVGRSKHLGANYKQALIEINAKEMIPFLIKTYNTDKKDHDVLTILLLLMKQGKYQPFLQSATHKKLYGNEYSYQAYITFNAANEQLILQRAMDYYQMSKK